MPQDLEPEEDHANALVLRLELRIAELEKAIRSAMRGIDYERPSREDLEVAYYILNKVLRKGK